MKEFLFEEIKEALQHGGGQNSRHTRSSDSFLFRSVDQGQTLRRIRESEQLAPFRSELNEYIESTRETPIPELVYSDWVRYHQDGNRSVFDGKYSEKRKRLHAYALRVITHLSPSDERDDDLQEVGNLLWSICEETSWCIPAHYRELDIDNASVHDVHTQVDMTACETAFALAEIRHLLYDELPPIIRSRIVQEIRRRVLDPFQRQQWYWETWTNNWPAVCAASIGITTLYIESDVQITAQTIERLQASLQSFLSGFGNSGNCKEGIAYWRYGFGYFTYYAQALHQRTNGMINLLQSEQIASIASFPHHMQLSPGRAFNVSDSLENIYVHTGALQVLYDQAAEMKLPVLPRLSTWNDDPIRWGHCSRNLYWSTDGLLQQGTLSPISCMNDVQIVIHRHQIDPLPKAKADHTSRRIISLAVKGGHNAEPHNHNDLGHFVLHAAGESILTDLGMGEYSKQYFSNDRYTSIFTSSLGHSVPIINGIAQSAGNEHHARIVKYAPGTDYYNRTELILDLTEAYSIRPLQLFERQFIWQSDSEQSATLRLTDHFQYQSSPLVVTENFVSTYEPDQLQATHVVWKRPHAHLELRSESGNGTFLLDKQEARNRYGAFDVYLLRYELPLPNRHSEISFTFHVQLNNE